MNRKNRIDSIDAQVQTIQANSKPIRPPKHVHLFKTAEPFFRAIVEARERASWNDHDLILAATLANTQANAELLKLELAKEGDIVDGKVNPLHGIHETLCRRIIALSRLLQVHPGARLGQARETGRRTNKERELLDSFPDDELLAQPIPPWDA
jgi:phage terminase small subunit